MWEESYSPENKRTPEDIAKIEKLLSEASELKMIKTPSSILEDAHQDYLKEIQSPKWQEKQIEQERQVAALMHQVVGNELPYKN